MNLLLAKYLEAQCHTLSAYHTELLAKRAIETHRILLTQYYVNSINVECIALSKYRSHKFGIIQVITIYIDVILSLYKASALYVSVICHPFA